MIFSSLLLLAADCVAGLAIGSSLDTHRQFAAAAPDASALRRTSGNTSAKPAKLRVEVFYESMCPFCQQWMSADLQQLWTLPGIREQIELHLYPFGNAAVVGGGGGSPYVFQCQHGDEECQGNMIEACATQVIDEYVPFIGCLAATTQTYPVADSAKTCAAQLGIDFDKITQCTSSVEGNTFMANLGSYTAAMAAAREYVPWVLFDGQHYGEADKGRQLWQAACGIFKSRGKGLPVECEQAAIAASMDATIMKRRPGDAQLEKDVDVCWRQGMESKR